MRVIVPPVIVEGKVCRIVSPAHMLIEVQEWMGEYWLPSDILLLTASNAPPASNKILRQYGVPKEDHVKNYKRPHSNFTMAMLFALVAGSGAHRTIPHHYHGTGNTPSRKVYPGSKRFRRSGKLRITDLDTDADAES